MSGATGPAALASISKQSNVPAFPLRLSQASIEKFVGYTPKMKDMDDIDSDLDSEMYSEMYADSEIYSDYLHCEDFDPFTSPVPTTFWEREGVMLRHRESSYLHGMISYSRRNPSGTINYDWHNPADLKLFVNQRSLPDPYPKGVTLKYQYLRILNKADRDWRFRFMDLPAEMRLMIYRHLLLFPQIMRGTWNYVGRVFPSILRTSTEIHDEARQVLYEENMFTAVFTATSGTAGTGPAGDGVATCATVHSKSVYPHCAHAVFLRMPKGIDDYPEFLRRISRLEVNLSFTTDDAVELSDRATWPLNHYLYTLASFLMDGHQLKKLHLKLDISSRVDDSKYGIILYPLRRLRNVGKVTIEGHVPDSMKTKLIAEMESTEPAFNTMRHWKLIKDEAEAHLAVYEAMHGEPECTCGECPVPDCIEEMSFRLFHLANMAKDSCFGSIQEERFMAHLAQLRASLSKAKVQDLEKLVGDLIAKRAAQKMYDAVSDDGRLEEAAKIWTGRGHDLSAEYDPEEDWGDDDGGSTLHSVRENAEISSTSRNPSPEL